MVDVKVTNIVAVDLPDAWFQCISKILDVGFKYVIQQGSFVGQTRLEFDQITICIAHPYREPYDLMLPEIPLYLNIPNPVESGYIEQYLPYLMTGERKEDEDYTYGQRLTKFSDGKACIGHIGGVAQYSNVFGDQIKHFIHLLKKTPKTNQAILQVAQPNDCKLSDPPCLRHIDIRIKDGFLIFYPYFRSWDLWGGFPANLAAIAVLQKFMADEIGVDVGPMIASSKGLHIYGYVEELAKLRSGK